MMDDYSLESNFDKRGTFVGTLNYVSPEMVKSSQSTMGTDIWSLGCIFYKMLTGSVAFPGNQNHQVFEKILSKDFEYPEYLSVDAVALIDSMLMLNPDERLGCPDSKCSISSLKNHPFFKGVKFSDPKSLSLTPELIKYLNPDYQSPQKMDPRFVPGRSSLYVRDFNPQDVVCRGYLLKKNRWFRHQLRFFQLFKNGNLEYFKDFKYKGKMTIQKTTKIIKASRNSIEIPQADKTYVLIEVDKKD